MSETKAPLRMDLPARVVALPVDRAAHLVAEVCRGAA